MAEDNNEQQNGEHDIHQMYDKMEFAKMPEEDGSSNDAGEGSSSGKTSPQQRVLLNRFNKMKRKYLSRASIWPFLNKEEKDTCASIKKKLPSQYTSFMQTVSQKKTQFAHKVKSALSAIMPFLTIFLIALFIIIAVVAFINLIMPWLFNGDGKQEMSSPYGPTGADYYGVRMIYKDDEQASSDLAKDYTSTLRSITDAIDNDTSLTLTLKLNLPAENYAFDNLASFETEYNETFELVKIIADEIYKVDHKDAPTPPTGLLNTLNGIKYFGYGESATEQLKTKIPNYIFTQNLYNYTAPDGETTTPDILKYLTEKVDLVLSADEYSIRTEKVYVKDYVLAGDDAYLENIPAKNYVAMVIMPKSNLTLTKCSFNITDIDTSTFEISIENEENPISLTSEVWDNGEMSGKIIYQYTASQNISLVASQNTLNDSVNGISLFNIYKDNAINNENYLKTETDENNVSYQTFVAGGCVVYTTSNQPFLIAPYEFES